MRRQPRRSPSPAREPNRPCLQPRKWTPFLPRRASSATKLRVAVCPEFGKSDRRAAGPSTAIGMTILFGNANYSFQGELQSRPERTRISCHAALGKAACAPSCKGKAHEVHQRHQVRQEIRGSVVERSAVRLSGFPILDRLPTSLLLRGLIARQVQAAPRA
jgi:hypothetical protein